MLGVIFLSVAIMLGVDMVSVILLNFMAPKNLFPFLPCSHSKQINRTSVLKKEGRQILFSELFCSAMAGFLSSEIPRPLRRRLSRTTLHQVEILPVFLFSDKEAK
jgi:hypothetical protein